VLLAFHDHRLERVTDRSGEVARLPWSTVSRARIGGRELIPLLEDLLGTWPEIRVNIDVKEVGAIAPLVRAVRRTRALDRVCVASFSPRRLAAVRDALGPRLCTALSTRGAARLRVAASIPAVRRPAPADAGCAQLPERLGPLAVVTASLVDLAHHRGLPVHVWTVDDPARMRRLLDLGVDGIMTDELVALRDVLAVRGQWPA
jgi:glycerophosphoryl diester phosphodiesterase